MARTPNSEQKLAIEHNGGVVLSAGAGSGKTFVLVEHVIYLANQWKEECALKIEEQRGKFLQKKLSEIVLMTFTKDAAGELSHRLQGRIEEEFLEGNDEAFWTLIKDNISSMTLTTIHGFCAKLLTQGFFLDFDPKLNLLSDIEFKNKIKVLIERWFDINTKLESSQSFLDVVIANKKNLIDSFTKIFLDAKIRNSWSKLESSEVHFEDISKILTQIFELEEFDIALKPFDLEEYESESKKAWFKNLSAYNILILNLELKDKKGIELYLDFFTGVRWATPKKLGDDNVTFYYETVKNLRDYLKEYQEDLFYYVEDGKKEFINWAEAILDIFNYIEKEYRSIEGISFADLEYYVYKGLEDSTIADNISENYKYLIIDEFQDTSQIQFDIIRKIIKDDFSRIFCVGDVKQAIYGFRGGEIAVFENCQKLIPVNLQLNNNYRSYENIIKYNNIFFKDIFKKGLKFQGADKFSVDVVPQIAPIEVERDELGSINQMSFLLELEEKKKATSEEISLIEAQLITKRIQDLVKTESSDSICVLYKNLTPLKYLLQKMLEEKVEFTSQVKIKVDEDPYLSIFKLILDTLLLDESKTDNISEQIMGYLETLKFKSVKLEKVVAEVSLVRRNSSFLGLYFSIENLFFNLGFTNSSHKNNLEFIEQICLLAMDDAAKAWLLLRDSAGNSYSMKFQVGNSSVSIMTAHASKGLEFDHVILGGIHTNGKTRPNQDFFGTLPGSFRWKKDQSQRKPYYSPELLLEKAMLKRKEFSESKRLFYVANTRAVKTLHYCFIEDVTSSKVQSSDSNSWVKAISDFSDFEINNDKYDSQVIDNSKRSLEAPFFHIDNLGIIQKEKFENDYLACIPELSVTRLTSLAECPTKFYLKNICKISPEDSWFTELNLYKKGFDENLNKKSEETFEDDKINFGASRGTFIHETLSKMILKNLVIPREITNKKDVASLTWAKDELKFLSDSSKFISEVPIKFPFFGTMISGTPDLIINPLDQGTHTIVDFKTGKFSSDKVTPYWFQLKIYAFALYELGSCAKDEQISMELWFVDEQKKYLETVDYQALKEELLVFWKRITDLTVKNDQHCDECSFGNLCHYKKDSFAQNL